MKNKSLNHKIKGLDASNLKNYGNLQKLNVQVSIGFFKEALINFKREEFLSCIQALNKAIKYNSSEILFFLLKSFILGAFLKKIEDALKEIEKALTFDPQCRPAIKIKKFLLKAQCKEFCSIYI
ncbi:hypothetical protein LCGC14_1011390 [marine sediment metagenome]|uniref:Tetratricopeptide repeat protein n=1 Tax=marine sediment metagenome TaxID=412755 RepID=A0A0F9N4N8_9ZZZZ|nr:hypothetical protein [bacterium]